MAVARSQTPVIQAVSNGWKVWTCADGRWYVLDFFGDLRDAQQQYPGGRVGSIPLLLFDF